MSMMNYYFAALPLRRALPCPANLPCFFLIDYYCDGRTGLVYFFAFAFPPSELHEKVHD